MERPEEKREILSDPADYILDLSSGGGAVSGGETKSSERPKEAEAKEGGGGALGRPFLSVHFKCCKVYYRIYMTADGRAYAGHCPKCAQAVRVKIGPGGTSGRMFVVE